MPTRAEILETLAARQDTLAPLHQFTDEQLASSIRTPIGDEVAGDLFAGRAEHATEHITSFEEGFRQGSADRWPSSAVAVTRRTRRRSMKLLLTSGGIKNTSIQNALEALLGKPIAESSALYIPTAIYPFPGSAGMAWRLIRGVAGGPLCDLGWKSVGVLELTALPSIDEEAWVPTVQETDALLVGGGDPLYLCHWMRQSGLADLLPSLRADAVYVGVSAGSMAAAATFGETYLDPRKGSGEALTSENIVFAGPEGEISRILVTAQGVGLVDFAVIPHFEHEDHPDASLANAEQWAARLPVPTYAIDDASAIKVTDGGIVEVVSEGHWKLFTQE